MAVRQSHANNDGFSSVRYPYGVFAEDSTRNEIRDFAQASTAARTPRDFPRTEVPADPYKRLWHMLLLRQCSIEDVEQAFDGFRSHMRMRDAKWVWGILSAMSTAEIMRPEIPRQGSIQLQFPVASEGDRGFCMFLHPSTAVSNVTINVGGRVNLRVSKAGL